MIDVMEEKELYLAEFSRFEKALRGKGPAWLQGLRAAAIERFAELGFPGPRDEDWKFTSLTALRETAFKPAPVIDAHKDIPGQIGFEMPGQRLVFVNGRYASDLSTHDALPRGVVVGSLAAALQKQPALLEPHLARHARYEDHTFTALNTAFLDDGAFVYLPRGAVVREPIHLVFLSTPQGEPTVAHPRTLIVAEDNSQAAVVQSYHGSDGGVYFTNAVTEIVAGPNAHVDHYKLQREGEAAFHLETLQVRQDRASNLSSHAITLGGGWVRNEARALLDAEGCECTLNGLYMAGGRQHVDNRTVIDHAKPHCASHELYKGILDGKAHGVFNGKIFVRLDAQKTDAKQTNQTLLLSDDAVINTKPQLEIFADDVKCTHGATVGNLSTEAIFYLRSRGISLDAARAILTFAFANDIIDRVKIDPLRRRLERLLLARHQLPAEADLKELT
jgi:Fe-S cluster assembly protein SufD